MARDVSIMISAKDNYSTAITKMLSVQTQFRKDSKKLNEELEHLRKNQASLKADMTAANKAMKEAEKAFKATGEAADRMNYEAAQANYENIKQNYELVSKAAKQAQKDMQAAASAASKTQNQFASTPEAGQKSMMQQLSSAGLIALVGDSLGDAAGTLVTSAFGSAAGGMINSTISGATSGAAMGAFAGPAGMGIGAAVGALSGAINGLTQVYEQQDDAFRELVQGTYTEIQEARQQSLTGGAGTAAQREMDLLSFSTLLGGEGAAADFLAKVRTTAAKTPFGYEDLTSMAKVLSTYGYTPDQMLGENGLINKIGDTGSALGLSGSDMAMVATYIGRMNSSNKTTLEYLNPLIERGIPAIDYLSEALGKSKNDIYDMISKGLIPGSEAAKVIADYMGEDFAGNMEAMSQTYSGLTSTLEDLQANADAAMGEGYIEERKKGLEEQIAWMEGASGERMQEANRLIGAYEASLENEQERLLREAMDTAYKTIEEQGITDEVEMGRILAEAQSQAKSEYLKSEAYTEQVEAQNELVNSIQSDMKDAWYNAGYSLGQNFSEGMAAAVMESFWADPEKFSENTKADGVAGGLWTAITGGGKAFGMYRVPYDGFPALLHEGEQVLTAAEARRSGGEPVITITGNSFSVREEADIGKIAQALAHEVSLAYMSYTG